MTSDLAPAYITSRVTSADVLDFDCGELALNSYFEKHAVKNDEAGIGRCYVHRRTTADEASLPPTLGFYTLSMADIESEHASQALRRTLPRYPIPAALIGRFAIDRRAQGRGVGRDLLVDALRRAAVAAQGI